MTFRKVSTAFAFAVSLLSTVLHGDLEAAGWMIDHDHGHSHHDDTHSDEVPNANGEHDPVIARSQADEDRILVPSFLENEAAFSPAQGEWSNTPFRLRTVEYLSGRSRLGSAFPTNWQFKWRCAAESTAPPTLS